MGNIRRTQKDYLYHFSFIQLFIKIESAFFPNYHSIFVGSESKLSHLITFHLFLSPLEKKKKSTSALLFHAWLLIRLALVFFSHTPLTLQMQVVCKKYLVPEDALRSFLTRALCGQRCAVYHEPFLGPEDSHRGSASPAHRVNALICLETRDHQMRSKQKTEDVLFRCTSPSGIV